MLPETSTRLRVMAWSEEQNREWLIVGCASDKFTLHGALNVIPTRKFQVTS